MRIKIIAPSDGRKHEMWWGDYWVKKDLEAAFIKHGYEIVKEKADLDFYLFGGYSHANQIIASRKFCWIYSHPDNIREDFLEQFEHIFVLSKTFLSEVKNSSALFGASSKEFIPRRKEIEYDIVFVGNASKPKRVEAIKYLIGLKRYKMCLVGEGWIDRLGGQIEEVDYKGSYTNNADLGGFFNQGILSFYSAHEDMRRQGFVAVRILDIFRSSENLCISDDNIGLKHMFRNIPTYKDKEDLADKIDWFLQHPKEREEIALKCRKDAKQWTFTRTITEIEKWINA